MDEDRRRRSAATVVKFNYFAESGEKIIAEQSRLKGGNENESLLACPSSQFGDLLSIIVVFACERR